MKTESGNFFSDGMQLRGTFYGPDESNSDKPLIVICSGFLGLNNIHPARFARKLTQFGYPCFGFDYRGFGESDGERGEVLLEDQVRDIHYAVSFVKSELKREGDRRKILLAGWGMAGGLIFEAMKTIEGVDGLLALNGFFHSKRVQKVVRGEKGWVQFCRWFEDSCSEASITGETKKFDPFDIYPLDSVTREYVDQELRKNPKFGTQVDLAFAHSLLGFQVDLDPEIFSNVPLFIGHGDQNALHPPGEAEALFQNYPGPKELFWVKGGGHTEWMLDDHPKFNKLTEDIKTWLEGRF